MLSTNLFLVAILNILLFITYGLSDTLVGVAYDIDYRVEDATSDYCGYSESQIYFDDKKFEIKSIVEENTPNNEKLYFETQAKGTYLSLSNNVYSMNFTEHTSNFIGNKRLPETPIINSFYSAERYLPYRNSIEIKHRSENYLILISFINGGQILALARH
ncbi:hypothetical protein [Vibrio sp. S12_S33]|uniref:hypothetical protein n=1 Tax=Vibrio sp. S12_S33 TaxID=2720223 RepID=UPI0017831EE1|nr:hypothetical protein [Vibrio sp. S12_S33]MBD1566214.1 hypothetical protein [Vibrio sp. S12_S33]